MTFIRERITDKCNAGLGVLHFKDISEEDVRNNIWNFWRQCSNIWKITHCFVMAFRSQEEDDDHNSQFYCVDDITESCVCTVGESSEKLCMVKKIQMQTITWC